jgi:hypothetical protein
MKILVHSGNPDTHVAEGGDVQYISSMSRVARKARCHDGYGIKKAVTLSYDPLFGQPGFALRPPITSRFAHQIANLDVLPAASLRAGSRWRSASCLANLATARRALASNPGCPMKLAFFR